jgi:hypothetical protein
LAILAGTTHYDIFSRPALADTAIPFLDAVTFQPAPGHASAALFPATPNHFHDCGRKAAEITENCAFS